MAGTPGGRRGRISSWERRKELLGPVHPECEPRCCGGASSARGSALPAPGPQTPGRLDRVRGRRRAAVELETHSSAGDSNRPESRQRTSLVASRPTTKQLAERPANWGRREQDRGRPYASEFEHSRRFEHPLVLAQGSRGAAPSGVRYLAHGTGLLLRARFVAPPTGRCSEPRPSRQTLREQRSGGAGWPGSRLRRSSSWCSLGRRRHSFIQHLLRGLPGQPGAQEA